MVIHARGRDPNEPLGTVLILDLLPIFPIGMRDSQNAPSRPPAGTCRAVAATVRSVEDGGPAAAPRASASATSVLRTHTKVWEHQTKTVALSTQVEWKILPSHRTLASSKPHGEAVVPGPSRCCPVIR